MRFYLYILRSTSSGRFYVGHTEDVARRLAEHNQGRASSTRNRGPWEVIHTEEFATRSEASRRERAIKKMKSHAWMEQLARASR
ncbi:MAG: GIY-YIG nuclease family protein [Terriglobia bacterium]